MNFLKILQSLHLLKKIEFFNFLALLLFIFEI
jgi:hypothetical protein